MTQLDKLIDSLQRRLFVEVEASGRHVHLTKAQAHALFGHDLTPEKPLSQPGQFAAKERVEVIGPKGKLSHVAVLGPCRSEGQVEVSVTDARVLGLTVPVRLSGDVADTPGCILAGPMGQVGLSQGVIAAQRHIHMSPEEAALQGVRDGQKVSLKLASERPVTFEAVTVRVRPDFRAAAHIDYDEANACGWHKGDLGLIVP